MKTTILLFLILLLFPANSSLAQLDPGANSIGIYFDLDATVNCIDTYCRSGLSQPLDLR